MEVTVVYQSIAIIAMMIIIGVLISRSIPITEETKKVFTSIIVNVAMPCIILSSVFNMSISANILKNLGLVFIFSIIINIIGMLIGWFLASSHRGSKAHRAEIALLSGLGNTGFIGIPLCSAIFGHEGALYAAIFDAGVDIVIWTLGVMILSNRFSLSLSNLKNLINIPIIAIVIGLLCATINYSPPTLITGLINNLAALASPLAMFYIGFLITSTPKSTILSNRTQVILPSSIKLLLLPIVTILLFLLLQLDFSSLLFKILFVQSTMPALTLSSILFTRYAKDDVFGALTTVVSTIFSIITIPLILVILSKYF